MWCWSTCSLFIYFCYSGPVLLPTTTHEQHKRQRSAKWPLLTAVISTHGSLQANHSNGILYVQNSDCHTTVTCYTLHRFCAGVIDLPRLHDSYWQNYTKKYFPINEGKDSPPYWEAKLNSCDKKAALHNDQERTSRIEKLKSPPLGMGIYGGLI